MSYFSVERVASGMKPRDHSPQWSASSAQDRVKLCVEFLRMHGFLSARDQETIQWRIMKWQKANEPHD